MCRVLYKEHVYSTNAWEYLLNTYVFMSKVYKTIEVQAKKVNFLLTNGVFGHWFHYICREFADSVAPGDT